ncbi:unnamed protein product [marine sediment metagenome]|uniref:Uncharacterized protein n=1 Tax=marine sediment metagenome TaxID=412755 RepID=X0Z197_9ZZZZ
MMSHKKIKPEKVEEYALLFETNPDAKELDKGLIKLNNKWDKLEGEESQK